MVTPLPASTRYYYETGIPRVYWATAIATPSNPLRHEIDAAVDLSDETTRIIGWQVVRGVIVDPPWGRFDAQRRGRIHVDEAAVAVRADLGGVDVRTVIAGGDTGYALILPSGDQPGHPMNVFPATVAKLSQPVSERGPALIRIDFNITSEPFENVPVPA